LIKRSISFALIGMAKLRSGPESLPGRLNVVPRPDCVNPARRSKRDAGRSA
jgi:hypothetical protein